LAHTDTHTASENGSVDDPKRFTQENAPTFSTGGGQQKDQ
jgi:hypothetical protein